LTKCCKAERQRRYFLLERMSKFRTIEVSDPQFESNSLRFITVKSTNLKGRGDICVYVPANTKSTQTLPVVLLLHGVYGSAWSWPLRAGVHSLADKMIATGELPPMILAMPSDGLWGDGSGYLPHTTANFEKWIVEDVPAALSETIKGAKPESPMFIAGMSMGGFGALRIGAKYGNFFKGISGHSSITAMPQIKFFVEEALKNYSQNDVIDEDVFATMKHYRNHLPPLRFDCGLNDPLLKYNRELNKKLSKAGILHAYQEFSGGHDWNYWATHIADTLKFFASQL
jgi:putative tributyrin esterase